jgi:hypothetical protein
VESSPRKNSNTNSKFHPIATGYRLGSLHSRERLNGFVLPDNFLAERIFKMA